MKDGPSPAAVAFWSAVGTYAFLRFCCGFPELVNTAGAAFACVFQLLAVRRK
jgi:hypothetical protein